MLLTEQEATKELPRSERMGETSGKMKQFATWFTHGVPGGARLRAAIYHAKTGTEVLGQVETFFAGQTGGAPSGMAQNLDAGFDDAPEGFPEAALICD